MLITKLYIFPFYYNFKYKVKNNYGLNRLKEKLGGRETTLYIIRTYIF